MPRRTTPTVLLALNPAEAARAFGLLVRRVYAAIDSGELIVRQLGTQRRIAVFGDGGLQQWFESWPQAATKKRK
jgi:hypothetical protein